MAKKKKTTTRKARTKKAPAKRTRKQTPAKKANGKLSALDAAAKVLTASKKTMNVKELIKAMASKRLWKSPGGKTPDRTLYAAITREIATKGKVSRFKKAGKGQFALAGRS